MHSKPSNDSFAFAGVITATLCMIALGLWTGADTIGREYFLWVGLPPSRFLQFVGRLPIMLGVILYLGTVVGMTLTFLRQRWWLFGIGAYLAWAITHELTFRIVDARLGHFRETAAGANEPLALLLLIFPPPVFAAVIAFLGRLVRIRKEHQRQRREFST